ncbi:ABC transporter ATP-binding protein [Pseudonocardia halophobica]|uniref:ABC transporter ATP-binding protein n=1 Tax=Pseudonocardia halophobica TaxID=29401 RepID=UPI003D8DDEA4
MTEVSVESVRPAEPVAGPAVEVAGGVVAFGGVRAVDGIDLTVPAGSLCGIVGPNGSGKTTLLNAVSGVQRLTEGTIVLGRRDTTGLSAHAVARTGVARTFQTIKLLPTLSVRQNVALGVDMHGTGAGAARRREATAATDRALERLGITAVADRSPEELSYGTRRRVEIARAIASGPSLLLLDEPLAGMNRAERVEIAELITGLRADGLTQLLIEHDLRTLLAVCDHLAVLHHGRLIAFGAPRETAARRDVRDVYLGRSDDGTA